MKKGIAGFICLALLAVSAWVWGAPTYQPSPYNQDIFNSAFAAKTTDDLAEGSNYLYFTQARARAALTSSATGLTYNATTGVFSLTTGYAIPTSTALANAATAYGWGNHASAGYAPLVSPTFSGTVGGITAGMVGLGNVLNCLQVQAVSPGDPADGAYVASKMCLVRVAGAGGVSKHQLVYQTGTASTVGLAKADVYATSKCLGMAVADAAEGAPVTILEEGLITNSAWSWTVGAEIYVSDVTAGLITSTAPTSGHFQKRIAEAKTATTIKLISGRPIVGVP